ncbi:hypothetical protein HHK36_008265 [Tetracentron sinense]|uniref:VQ domain-containing protein n=1 Tax=Tetracentron sinense TaxID=13715 RepID=A0A834ZI52_TETSI|nr:hypothetical protein HHK36_008265 [Tetracentron sinense]
MDPYSSSSSSTSLINPQKAKRPTPPSSLHSVRKPPAKKAAAPLPPPPPPPPPPRVYKVDSTNFRQVVQKLTGAPEFRSRRLQSVAPPPLNLVPLPPCNTDVSAPLQLFCSPVKSPLTAFYNDLMCDTLKTKPGKLSHGSMATSPFGFNLSALWCSFPLLSPGTLASFEQGTVL